jgi:hypothetical protein
MGCQPHVNTKKYFDGRRQVVIVIIIIIIIIINGNINFKTKKILGVK